MFEKLKTKWGIETSFQLIIIFIVFAITGSVAAKISDPITVYLNLDTLPGLFYWPIRFLAFKKLIFHALTIAIPKINFTTIPLGV